jgi:hypothetical protein
MVDMKVFDLCCDQDHRFEGWFGSEADYDRQMAASLIECPLCASREIRRLPSAPRLNLSQAQAPAPTAPEPDSAARAGEARAQLQAMWMQMARRIIENTEDVGTKFAEEARKIHYQEAEERAIRGVATAEETAALADEGIEVLSLPLPSALKGPLQ